MLNLGRVRLYKGDRSALARSGARPSGSAAPCNQLHFAAVSPLGAAMLDGCGGIMRKLERNRTLKAKNPPGKR